MRNITPEEATANDIPYILASINCKMGIICDWIQNGANQQNPHAILNMEEAVAFTGYSRSAIHSFTSEGTIPHFKRGNKLYFHKDELATWLESDERPKKGKRFKNTDKAKESDVTDCNQEPILIAEESANDTDSVAEALDKPANHAETATSVPEEAVSAGQCSDILPFTEVSDDTNLESLGSDGESHDTSSESASNLDTDVVNDVNADAPECMQEASGSEAQPDEHLSNYSVQQQSKDITIPHFPYFCLERHQASDSDANADKTVIRFFNKIPYEHFRHVCDTIVEHHGQRIGTTVSFEFESYDDALNTANAINDFMSSGQSETH